MRYVVAFGRFWYDFLVGDSLVLAIGTVAAVAGSLVLARAEAGDVAQLALPAFVLATLVLSLREYLPRG
jgi:hypothetical protein